MRKPLVTDELWAAIEPLLPSEPPKPRGGRPRCDDRAVLAGIIFVLVVVATAFFGKKITSGHKLTFPLFAGGGAVASHYGSERAPKLPGTIVLVTIFFVCFVLYYFINWKYLSELWLFR